MLTIRVIFRDGSQKLMIWDASKSMINNTREAYDNQIDIVEAVEIISYTPVD